MPPLSRLFVEFRASTSQFASDLQKIQRDIREVDKVLKPIKTNAENIGKILTTALTVPIVAGAALATKAGIEYESAFAGVRKTVNATEAELAALSDQFRAMALEIPVAAAELATIGQTAGQLGIKKENIADFTKTMAALGVATNLSSTQAATALARFANITQLPQDQIDNLGSAVVALGNNMATTESEIVEFGLRIAGAGHQVGLTEAEILGLGAALSSVGIEAEAGGTAISRVLVDLSVAAAQGGAKLETFARVAGESSAQFAQHFSDDAAGATVKFIEGLDRMTKAGVNLFPVLDQLGLDNIRVRDALLRSAGAGDLVRRALDLSTTAYRENNALTKEAEQRYATTASQLKILRHHIDEIGITLFEGIGPILRNSVIPALKDFANFARDVAKEFAALDPALQKGILGIAGVAAVVGPALLAIVALAPGVATITGAIAGAGGLTAVLSGAVAVLTGPAGWIAGLTAAGAALGYFAYQNETVRDIVTIAWAGMKFVVSEAVGFVGAAITGLIDLIKKFGESAVAYLTPIAKAAIPGVSAAALALASSLELGAKAFDELKVHEVAEMIRLRDMVSAHSNLTESIKGTVGAMDAAVEGFKKHQAQQQKVVEAAAVLSEEQKKTADSFRATLRPADELNKELEELVRQFGAERVVMVYGERINTAATAQQRFNEGIKGTVSQLDAMFLRMQSAGLLDEGFAEMRRDTASAFQSLLDDISPQAKTVRFGAQLGPLPRIDATEQLKFLSQLELEAGFAAMKLDSVDAMLAQFGGKPLRPDPAPLFSGMTIAARNAAAEASAQIGAVSTSITELRALGRSPAEMIALLGSELQTAAMNAERFNLGLDEQTQYLVDQIDAVRSSADEARQWQQVWSQVLANITTDFARGMTDVIFQAKSLPGALADIGKTTGRAFTEAFFAELFSPLTNMLAGWGRELARVLQTSAIPKIAGSIGLGALFPGLAGAGTAAGAGAATGIGGVGAGAGAVGGSVSGTVGGTGLGLFGLSGAATLGIGAAVAGGIFAATKLIGRGREQADKFVQGIENPFGREMGLLVEQFNSARAAGALTLQDATDLRNQLVDLQRSFVREASEFAALGSSQRKVVEQAFAGLTANFGPNLSNVLGDMNSAIAELRKGSQGGPGLAETGRSYSASNIFATAVDRMVPALDRFTGRVGTLGEVHNHWMIENHFHLTADGVDNPRDLFERFVRMVEDNSDGVRSRIATVLANTMKGVTVSTV